MERLRPAGHRRPPPGGVGGLRGAPARRIGRRARRALAGAPGRTAEIVGIGPEVLGEFSVARRRHPPSRVRDRGPLGRAAASRGLPPVRPRRRAALRRPGGGLAATGRAVGGPPGARARAGSTGRSPAPVLDEHRFAGVISLTPHGGAHRRDVVAAFAPWRPTASRRLASSASSTTGCRRPVGVAEPLQQRRAVVPATTSCARLGPRPSIPTTTRCGWAPHVHRRLPGRWGLGRVAEALGAGAPRTAWPRSRRTAWPITSAPSGRSTRPRPARAREPARSSSASGADSAAPASAPSRARSRTGRHEARATAHARGPA